MLLGFLPVSRMIPLKGFPKMNMYLLNKDFFSPSQNAFAQLNQTAALKKYILAFCAVTKF